MTYVTTSEKIIKRLYTRRDNWSHKGDFGDILVIGGSREYTGSPALVALAGLRSGCDLAKIVAPERAADVCAGFSPELISIPFEGEHFSPDAIDIIKENLDWADVVTIGNGIGEGSEQTDFVNELLRSVKKRFVIDADALKVLDRNNITGNFLLTPNTNEFNILFEEKLTNDVEDRIKAVKAAARDHSVTILLKGHVDIISNGDDVILNKTNSPYMTKGGTGDTLTGICAALLAQGNSMMDSAAGGAFINGYSGRTAAKGRRESMSPMDLINEISGTITKWRYQ